MHTEVFLETLNREELDIPAISLFYGIIIYMYYFDDKEHKMPHIHANYAEYDVVVSIPEGEVLKGEMPNNKLTEIDKGMD